MMLICAKNRYSCLIVVICIGCLLFTTACSKYSSKFGALPNSSYDSTSYDSISSGVRGAEDSQRDSWTLDEAARNLDGTNLLVCNNWGYTLLCKAIYMGNADLLELFLGYIQSNPEKYPPYKVIDLIIGPPPFCVTYNGRSIKLNMPLLRRAVNVGVNRGNLDMVVLLLNMIRYDHDTRYLAACSEKFIIEKKAHSLLSIAVEAMDLKMLRALLDGLDEYHYYCFCHHTPFTHPDLSKSQVVGRRRKRLLGHLLGTRICVQTEYELAILNTLMQHNYCIVCAVLNEPNREGHTALEVAMQKYFEYMYKQPHAEKANKMMNIIAYLWNKQVDCPITETIINDLYPLYPSKQSYWELYEFKKEQGLQLLLLEEVAEYSRKQSRAKGNKYAHKPGTQC